MAAKHVSSSYPHVHVGIRSAKSVQHTNYGTGTVDIHVLGM